MGGVGEIWRAVRDDRRSRKDERRCRAAAEYERARQLAADAGLELVRRTDSHYQLRCARWIINLYPSTQKWHVDKNRDQIRVVFKSPWCLVDAVKFGAYKALQYRRGAKR